MINENQLKQLLSDLESDRVERTVSTSKTDKFAEAVCAFANDFPNHSLPGYLLIGVDNNGMPSRLKVTDDILKNLAALRSDGNIQPMPALTVGKFTLDGGDVAVVEVQPADMPPVRYKGKVWIRIGPRRGNATEQEERILIERRTSFARSFDAQPCRQATLDDLDAARFLVGYRKKVIAPDVIAENSRSLEQQLAGLNFFDLTHQCPTNAGMLMFCDRPTRFLPGAYIQFLRISGNEPTCPVHFDRKVESDLGTMMQTLDMLIDVNNRQWPEFVSSLREEMRSEYPRTALRELILNAMMHRSYQSNTPTHVYWFDDHIEISNPGGLYGEATPEHFPFRSDYRNPVVASALFALGYVNRYGLGILRAQKALTENDNPLPIFNFDPHWFSVRIDKRVAVAKPVWTVSGRITGTAP
jgi:ATP-dependent DNA helicase RecG